MSTAPPCPEDIQKHRSVLAEAVLCVRLTVHLIVVFLCALVKERYNYRFGWKLSTNDRGRRRLLFFYGEEFCGLDELPEGLIEIRDGFQRLNVELEKALSNLTKQSAIGKEAA